MLAPIFALDAKKLILVPISGNTQISNIPIDGYFGQIHALTVSFYYAFVSPSSPLSFSLNSASFTSGGCSSGVTLAPASADGGGFFAIASPIFDISTDSSSVA